MTKLEALQSMTEGIEVPDNLYTKVLLDREQTGGDTYAATDKDDIELCLADIYSAVANNVDFGEGSLNMKYDRAQLIRMAKEIYRKNGESVASIDGTSQW